MRDKQEEKVFSYSESILVLRAIVRTTAEHSLPITFDTSLLRITFHDEKDNAIARFRCPPAFPPAPSVDSQADNSLSDPITSPVLGRPPGAWTDADVLAHYAKLLDAEPPAAFVMLIQAGQAALGLTHRGLLREHKIIRKYMVRKSQGKSQLSYLKSKGKSRLGSRIRLQQSVEFFEEINTWLVHQAEHIQPERTLYACAASLWPHLLNCRIAPPFNKKDAHLMKIPRDFSKATLVELEHICRFIQKGRFSFDAGNASAVELLSRLKLPEQQGQAFSSGAENDEDEDYLDF